MSDHLLSKLRWPIVRLMRCRLFILACVVLFSGPIAVPTLLAQGSDESRRSALVAAGRLLFFDPQLSEPAGTSCASCHDPLRAFTGDNGSGVAVPRGSRVDQRGTRNTPTLMYLANSPPFGFTTKEGKTVPVGGFFWDGRANTLEEQARGPMLTTHEMNNSSVQSIVAKVAASSAAPLLRRARGDEVFANPERAMDALTAALAAFQQSDLFVPFSSKFDAMLRGQTRLNAQEQRGQSLFVIAQKGNCASCHTMNADSSNPRDSLFTDFSYHALGVPRNESIARRGDMDQGVCGVRATGSADSLRWCGWFKTPTLRNIAVTAPYMHNGQFATLREAVAFYATRDTNPELWYPKGKKFDDLPPALHGNVDLDTRPYHRKPGQRPALNDEEIDDIVAFLHALTDGYAP